MTREPITRRKRTSEARLRRAIVDWQRAETTGVSPDGEADAGAERALRRVFQALPPLAPGAGFTGRVLTALGAPTPSLLTRWLERPRVRQLAMASLVLVALAPPILVGATRQGLGAVDFGELAMFVAGVGFALLEVASAIAAAIGFLAQLVGPLFAAASSAEGLATATLLTVFGGIPLYYLVRIAPPHRNLEHG